MSDSDAPEVHTTAIDGSTAQPMTRSRQRAQAADAGSEHGDRRAAEEVNDDLARAQRLNEELAAELKLLKRDGNHHEASKQVGDLDVHKCLKHSRFVRKLDGVTRSSGAWAEYYSDLRTCTLTSPPIRECLAHVERQTSDSEDGPNGTAADHALFTLLQATTTGLAHQMVTGLERAEQNGEPSSGIAALRQLRDAVQPSTLGDFYAAVRLVAVPTLTISSRHDPRTSLLSYTTGIRTLEHQYHVQISEDLVVATIMHALPSEYDTLCTTLMSRPVHSQRPSVEEVTQLIQELWTGVLAHRTHTEAARYVSNTPRLGFNKQHLQTIQRRDEKTAYTGGTQARSWSDRNDHGRNANRDQGQKKTERVSADPCSWCLENKGFRSWHALSDCRGMQAAKATSSKAPAAASAATGPYVAELVKNNYALAVTVKPTGSTTNVLYRAPRDAHPVKPECLHLPVQVRAHVPASAVAVTVPSTKDDAVTKDNIDLSLDDDMNIAEQLKLMNNSITDVFNKYNSDSVMLSGLVNTVDETNKAAAAAAEHHVSTMSALQAFEAAGKTRDEAVMLQLGAVTGNLTAQSKVVIGIAGDMKECNELMKAVLTELDIRLSRATATETLETINGLLNAVNALVDAFNITTNALLNDEDNLSDTVVLTIADAAKMGLVKYLQEFPHTNVVQPHSQADSVKLRAANNERQNERRRIKRKEAKEAKAAAAAEHASDLRAAMELDSSDESDEAQIVNVAKTVKKRDRVAIYSASAHSSGPPAPPTLLDINMVNPSDVHLKKLKGKAVAHAVRADPGPSGSQHPAGEPPTSPVSVVIDSGATVHLFNNKMHFQELSTVSKTISSVGGGDLPITGTGTVHLRVPCDANKFNTLVLSDVYYVPQSPFNLLSVGLAEDVGLFVNFRDRVLTDIDNQVVANLERTKGEYLLSGAQVLHAPQVACVVRTSSRLAAKRGAISSTSPTKAPNNTKRAAPHEMPEPQPAHQVPTLLRLRATDSSSDRMIIPIVFTDLQRLVQEEFSVELFANEGNNHLPRYYSPNNDAFSHTWTNESFYANPPYDDAIIKALSTKAYKDWQRAPETTSFTLVLPDWTSASWHPSRHPPMSVFTLVHTFATGSEIFSAPPEGLGGERVLMHGTHWPVKVWHLAASPHVITSVANDIIVHMRLGHASGGIVSNVLARGTGVGLRLGPDASRISHEVAKRCRTCQIAKGFRPPHRTQSRERNSTAFGLMYFDFMGPFSASVTGARYVLAGRDDCTRWTVAVAVPSRKNAGASLEAALAQLQKFAANHARDIESGMIRKPVIGHIQTDCALEFINGSFPDTCARLGIMQRFTAPHEHRNNGVVERVWRDLQAMMRTLLHHSGLGSHMWPHALNHAVYLVNRMPTSRGDSSPYQVLTSTEPDLTNLRIWGCAAVQHLVYDQRVQVGGETLPSGANARKLADRGRSLIFVGFEENSKNVLLVSLSDPGKLVVTGLVANYDEASIADQRYHAATGELTRLRAEFDNDAPDSPMLQSRIIGRFAIIGHRTLRELDAADTSDDTHAIFHVATNAHPGGVWSKPEHLLEHSTIGYNIVERYLDGANEEGNMFYPLFVLAEHLEGDTWHSCIVIGVDNACKDGLDIRIAVRVAGEGADVLDVPRITIRTKRVETGLADDTLAIALAATPSVSAAVQIVTEPKNVRQALRGQDATEWLAAIEKEVSTLEIKGTWISVKSVPPDRTPILAVFKLKTKWNADGSLDKRKARLVAFGMCQTYGEDYTDTWAPSSQLTSVHLFLCLCVQLNLTAYHADAVSAFVNAELKETVYLQLPPEINRPYRYVQLLKSLYGLKQGAHDWHAASDAVMMSIPGMRKSTKETCWYFLYQGDLVAHILVHVDDYLCGCNQPEWFTWFVKYFGDTYEINNLGCLTQIVGMGATQTSDCITLSRSHQINQSIQRFHLGDANPVRLPLPAGAFKTTMPESTDPNIPFLALMGEMRYHARSAHPDLLLALSVLGKFSAKHQAEHFQLLKNTLLYVKGSDAPLIFSRGAFGPSNGFRIGLYTDAAYNSCSLTGRSQSGWVVTVNDQPMLWHSERQTLVTTSSTYAEVVACSDGIKDLMYVHDIISEFAAVELPMIVHQDNMATIRILDNPVNNGITKYIAVKYFWIREFIENNTIKLQHISGANNPADFLTKPLGGEAFHVGRARLMGHTSIHDGGHVMSKPSDGKLPYAHQMSALHYDARIFQPDINDTLHDCEPAAANP